MRSSIPKNTINHIWWTHETHPIQISLLCDQALLKVQVLVTQSCLTLSDSMDSSLLGSSVHGILQAKILEWVAMTFSRGSSQHRDRTWVSHIAGRCFTFWATRDAQGLVLLCLSAFLPWEPHEQYEKANHRATSGSSRECLVTQVITTFLIVWNTFTFK